LAPDGSQYSDVKKRRYPIVGDGGGVYSFIHVDDAAAATVLATEEGQQQTIQVESVLLALRSSNRLESGGHFEPQP
jgi:hypothetical protein